MNYDQYIYLYFLHHLLTFVNVKPCLLYLVKRPITVMAKTGLKSNSLEQTARLKLWPYVQRGKKRALAWGDAEVVCWLCLSVWPQGSKGDNNIWDHQSIFTYDIDCYVDTFDHNNSFGKPLSTLEIVDFINNHYFSKYNSY